MGRRFVDRTAELAQLRGWWARPGPRLGLVWGRRRVGKTYLLEEFSRGLPTIFYTARGADPADELAELSRQAARAIPLPYRDLASDPFRDWRDALATIAGAAEDRPLLMIVDEFPELASVERGIENTLRSFWDRVKAADRSKLRILLSGSAVRITEAIQEHRAPLYGRFDLKRLVQPFRPHEAALMLDRLVPGDRALVWGLTGGMPTYLEWWDQDRSVRANLSDLACTPGGLFLEEGAFVIETEGSPTDLARQVLFAIASGKNRFSELTSVVKASHGQIANVLKNLEALDLLEREVPVTEDETRRQGGRTSYRIHDNFLAFWLGVLARHRGEVYRGLGRTVLPSILQGLDDHMGPRYEEALRAHLRRMAERGDLGPDVVAVGRFWRRTEDDPAEIDAVVLSGRGREAILVGEARWARTVDGAAIRRDLERKAGALPRAARALHYAVAARDKVRRDSDVLAITATDIFEPG